MEINNKERIGRALDILKKGVAPFVEREVKKGGVSKEDILKIFEDKPNWLRKIRDEPINKWDISTLFSVMWHYRKEVFNKTLNSADMRLVLDSRNVRNKWAHSINHFSDDDIILAFDVFYRLLKAISAPQSKDIRKLQKNYCIDLKNSQKSNNKIDSKP